MNPKEAHFAKLVKDMRASAVSKPKAKPKAKAKAKAKAK